MSFQARLAPALTITVLLLASGAAPVAANLPPAPPFEEMTVGPDAAAPQLPTAEAELALRAILDTLRAEDEHDPVLQGLDDFYRNRDDRPVWIRNGTPTRRAVLLRERIARAAEDGLDPEAFDLPAARPAAADAEAPAPEAIAAEEIALSRAAVLYARQAQGGRLHPRAVSALMTAVPQAPDAEAVLETLTNADDVAAALEAYNPPHEQFRALRAALAVARGALPPPPADPLPAGPALAPGVRDPRIEVLRRRLGVAATDDPTLYDDTLRLAVIEFQRGQGLARDGVVGTRTRAALNGSTSPAHERVDVILANMERWRWMPRDLGRAHVYVDIPGYTAEVVRDGTVAFRTRVVVGTPSTPTPVFSDTIRFLVVNPYWNVPVSIASREMLPKIQANPSGYFASRNYEAVVDGQVIEPGSIAWTRESLARVRIRQRPGDDNALGNIKFMFPNEHAVYLHDTPSKALFGRSERALSHGCVRVDDPMAFAAALLADESNLSAGKVRKLIGGRERRLDLQNPVPVHLTYFTAVADEHGSVSFRRDIYGFDGRIVRALQLRP